jgi:hypothetical protein
MPPPSLESTFVTCGKSKNTLPEIEAEAKGSPRPALQQTIAARSKAADRNSVHADGPDRSAGRIASMAFVIGVRNICCERP